MSEKPEALWIVSRWDRNTERESQRKVFRTREAARAYASDTKRARSMRYSYYIDRATWGPEQ